MDTTAFDLLVVPTLWVTLAGIVAGAALLFLIRTIENVIMHFSSESHSSEEFPGTSVDPLPRPARPVTRGAVRFHG
jgi:hypothetical protein